MSEKRKPAIVIVASVKGKTAKTELFPMHLWPKKFPFAVGSKFRVRMNGKWANGDQVYTLSEVMRQMRGWLARRMRKP